MSIKKLYRVILRQRVNWTGLPLGTVDGTSNASIKPTEIEGNSIERDITAFVADYKKSSTLESLSNDLTLDLNNPDGVLTPDNTKSAHNWTVLNGVNTFTPLLVKGAEIQVYRITDAAYLDPSYRNDETKWKPKFRGEIKAVKFGTQAGQDALQVVVGDALYRANKTTLTGSFSPIMRSSSQCPGNSFYTISTLQSAVTNHFRDTPRPAMVMDPNGHFTPTSLAETGEIPDYLLARLLYWDRDDHWRTLGKKFTDFYFVGTPYEDETADTGGSWIPVNATTATAVWTLNGNSWFVESGTVVKDTSAGNIFSDSLGSMKLTTASMRHTVRKIPGNLPSRLTFGYKLADDVSTITVKLVKRQFQRTTLSYVGTDTVLYAVTLQGKTQFDPALLGGTMLNSPSDVLYTWKRANLDPLPSVDATSWDADNELDTITVVEMRFEVAGTAWIDLPRWEFISVDRNANNTSWVRDNNIMNYPMRERWITTDGVTYTDPYPEHRTLSKKNVQVVMRSIMVPYAAGTDLGYGPAHLRNRNLPETGLYERELTEGQDFEILYDKGAIQLSYKYPQVEIFVRHTEYDLAASGHMEAATMMKHLMVTGMGHDPNKIFLEPTGIILSRITLDASTNTSVAKAIQDIRQQIPQNYYIYADGNANIIGKFIQQSGSPRILNPIKQAPVPQISGGVLQEGQEYWYAVTSLMADGKETLPSNLMATVDYFNYFDATHKSTVEGGVCPALPIKPVPGQLGFVIRRAVAYKTAASTITNAAPVAKAKFGFEGADPTWQQSTIGTSSFSGPLTAAIQLVPVAIATTGGRRGGNTLRKGNLHKVADASEMNARGEYKMMQLDPEIDTAGGGDGTIGEIPFVAHTQPDKSAIRPNSDTRTKTMTALVDLRDGGQETGKVALRFELELPKTAIHPEAASGFEILRLGPANTAGTLSIKYVPVQGSGVMPHELVVSVYGDTPTRSVTVRPKIAGVLMEVYVEYDGMVLTASAGGSVDQKICSTRIAPPTYGSSGTALNFGIDALGTAYDSLELYSTTIASNALVAHTQFPYFTWDQSNSGVIAVIPTDPTEVATVLANRSWYTFIDRGYSAGHLPGELFTLTGDTFQAPTNLLTNSRIEKDSNADGWADQFSAYACVDTPSLIAGCVSPYAQQVRVSDTTNQIARVQMKGQSGPTGSVPVVYNGVYTVQVMMLAPAGTNLRLVVKTLTSGGAELAPYIANAVATGSFQKVTLTLTVAEPTATQLLVMPGVYLAPVGTLFAVDGIQVEAGSTASAYQERPTWSAVSLNINGLSTTLPGFEGTTPAALTDYLLTYKSGIQTVPFDGKLEQFHFTSNLSGFNNPSTSGNTTGWTLRGSASSWVVESITKGSGPVSAQKIVTTAEAGSSSPYINVGPNDVIEVPLSVMVTDNLNPGTRFMGILARDASDDLVIIERYNPITRVQIAGSQYSYWSAVNPGNTNTWLDVVGYVLGCNVDPATVPLPNNQNANYLFRLPSSASKIAIRFLNYYNAGSTSTTYFWLGSVRNYTVRVAHRRGSTDGQMSFTAKLEGVKSGGGVVAGLDKQTPILGKIPQQYLLPHTGQINEGVSILGATVTISNLKGIQLEQKDESCRTVGKVIGSVKNRPGSSAALVTLEPISFYGSHKAPFPAKSLIYGYPETISGDLPSTKYYSYAVVWERFLQATASATVGNQPMRRAPHNRSRQGDHIAAFSVDVPPGTTLRGISINFVSAPTALEGNAAGGRVYPGWMSSFMPNLPGAHGPAGMTYDWGFGEIKFPQMLSGSGDYSLLFYPLVALDDDATVWQPIPSIGVDAVKVSGANLWHTISFKQVDYDTLLHIPSGGRLLDGSRRVHVKLVLASEISAVTYQGLSYRIDPQPKK